MVVFGSFRVSLPLRPQAGPMVLEGTEKKKRLYAQSSDGETTPSFFIIHPFFVGYKAKSEQMF